MGWLKRLTKRSKKQAVETNKPNEGPSVPDIKDPEPVPTVIPQATVPPEATSNQYVYTPLKDARNFRILHLQRRPQEMQTGYIDVTLQGSIIEANLDNAPDFFALSYTWGAPALCKEIALDNGKVLKVTQNCADALRRMLRGKMERMIWVDSICINQGESGLEERGRQVALMGEIYRKAGQVNVFLGVGDAASDTAVMAVRSLTQAYLSAKLPGPKQEAGRVAYEALADDVLATTNEYPYGKLHGIFRHAWFRRTWVLQEVALARKVMFYCGDHMLAFDNLVVAADFSRLPYSKLNTQGRHWNSYLAWHHTFNEIIRRYDSGERDVCQTLKLGLLELLVSTTSQLQATRAEDKVYGLYGLAKKLDFALPVPDYTKPVGIVYTEAALACLRQGQSLKLLESVEGSAADEYGLPSWVPNLSGSLGEWTVENPPKTNINARSNKMVSGDSHCEWSLMPNGRSLRVRGRRVDQVAAVGEAWKVDHRTTLLGDAETNSGQYIGSLIDCIVSWLELVLQRNSGAQGSGSGAVDEFAAIQDLARLLTNGLPSLVEPLDRIIQYLSVVVNCARASNTIQRFRLVHPEDSFLEIRRIGPFFMSAAMERVITQIGDSMWRTVFRTTCGYLGVGSYSSRPGDMVVVFHGMAGPCLVRPTAEGFRYVGAAFVDGIMMGEFWDKGSSIDDEWFVLV